MEVIVITKAEAIFKAIQADPQNAVYTQAGIKPLYQVMPEAEILITSQAPSRRAQESMLFWDDPSGDRLREWMGLSRDQFYNSGKIAILPLDFYFPGKGGRGDLPPRKGFAEKWHAPLCALMPTIQLNVVLCRFAPYNYLQRRRRCI